MVLMLAVGPVIVWVGGVQVRQERAQRDAQSTAQHRRQTYQPALVQVHDYRSSPNDASVIVIWQSALDFRRAFPDMRVEVGELMACQHGGATMVSYHHTPLLAPIRDLCTIYLLHTRG